MNRYALIISALAATAALAQVRVEVNIPLPTITFEAAPTLVVAKPGVQVIENYDDEVFVVDDGYWYRRGDTWFRAPNHRGKWVVVQKEAVPPVLVTIPPGHYKRWKRGKGTVVVNPPGPGKVKVKVKGKDKHHDKD